MKGKARRVGRSDRVLNDSNGHYAVDSRAAAPSDGEPYNANRPLDSTLPVDAATLNRNLWLFIWLKVIVSYDSGAFSAAIGATDGIASSWRLNVLQQGVLTSSVFLGNVLGCLLAGHFFSKYSEKKVLVLALAVHTIFTLLFALYPVYHVGLVNRFFIGLTLAFNVVYTPVWVDEFAPKNRQSIWMASHNAGVPLGIMMGYIIVIIFVSRPTLGWDWAFYIKCIMMVPTIAYLIKVDTRSINTRRRGVDRCDTSSDSSVVAVPVMNTDDEEDVEKTDSAAGNGAGGEGKTSQIAAVSSTSKASGQSGTHATAISSGGGVVAEGSNSWADCSGWTRYLQQLGLSFYTTMHPLLSNSVYMICVFSLSSLYFVATGLQNFVTQYLYGEPFNATKVGVTVGFSIAVVTAPVLGVIAGGLILDRLGGYQDNLLTTTIFIIAWGIGAVFFSIVCIFMTTTATFLSVMSLVLFCGGAIIPSASGLTISLLPDRLRSVGAAFAQTLYNLLGNFSGPLVCGFVAEQTGKLSYGIMTLLLCSFFGVLPMFFVLYVAVRESARKMSSSVTASGSGVVVVALDATPAAPLGNGTDAREEMSEATRCMSFEGGVGLSGEVVVPEEHNNRRSSAVETANPATAHEVSGGMARDLLGGAPQTLRNAVRLAANAGRLPPPVVRVSPTSQLNAAPPS